MYKNTNFNNKKYVNIYSNERKNKKIKPKISILKIILFVIFICIGMVGSGMIYVYTALKSFNYKKLPELKYEKSNIDKNYYNDNMVLNILLIGSDSMSTGDSGRSDSLLIGSLNTRDKKIKITSIMRDIWVSIPNYGKDRINASYAYGGSQLTMETIKKNFGLVTDRYICVDFESFSKIIDILDGIDIELTSDECKYINKYSGDKTNILKGSGLKHLTGLQALHHSRNRNSKGSDYDRTSRQREVLKSMISSLKSANVSKVMQTILSIAPIITTDFTSSEILRLSKGCMEYLSYDLEEFRLPTNDNVVDEIHDEKMVLTIKNTKKAIKDLNEFIYGVSDDKNK